MRFITASSTVWKACEELDLAIFVHPWNMMGKKHMEKYWLPWLVGMPAETARAIASMIEQLNSTYLQPDKDDQERFNFFMS